MRLATWNVNSIKVRLPQLIDWLSRNSPDVLCVQETKLEDSDFPVEPIERAGFHALYSGQRAYNGVALISKRPGADACKEVPGLNAEEKRLVAATIGDIRVICAYVPNGQSIGSNKYPHKLQWLATLKTWVEVELKRYSKLALLGDLNVAPEDRDVYDPLSWEGQVLVSAPERAAFRELLAAGLRDSFRLFPQPEKSFTWWDYRAGAFRRNMGLRIDHILLSPELAVSCNSCAIDTAPRKHERPSDHAPVVADIESLPEVSSA